ncbi:MAG TPA: ABC transporter ATP-binding protein [Nitrospiria bacterium]|nr:ABC transporter ATP-binding protein [Nitrospiria bacterium]
MTPSVLKLEDVHTWYGPIEAIKGISLEVKESEIVALIGANGAGKSTTLMTISGALAPRQGRIKFLDQNIAGLPTHEIVGRGISQVPEGRRIFPRLTVLENLEMGAFLQPDPREREADLSAVFEQFPILKERQSQRGGTLSGGEQQMLAIGRALMARPRLLLLDEPSLGLAPVVVGRIFDIIRKINRQGKTILLVEQNARAALNLAHRGYVMETGRIVMADEARALLSNPRVREAYLGEG